jgi:hypothetical protein
MKASTKTRSFRADEEPNKKRIISAPRKGPKKQRVLPKAFDCGKEVAKLSESLEFASFDGSERGLASAKSIALLKSVATSNKTNNGLSQSH